MFHPLADFSIVAAPFGMFVAERLHLLTKFLFESLGLITATSFGVFFNFPTHFVDVSFEFFVLFREAFAMLPLVVVSFSFTIGPLTFISPTVPVTPLFIACSFLVANSVPISFADLFAFSIPVISFLAPTIDVTFTFSRSLPFTVFRFGGVFREVGLCSGFLCVLSFRI
jgi:hypothetical protein